MSCLLTTQVWNRLTAVNVFAIFPVHVYEVLMMQRIFPYIVPPTQYGATAMLSLDRLLITDVAQGWGE